MDLLEGIKGNKFVVFGRAGMDMFADPVGTKSEFADTFKSDLGGSSANMSIPARPKTTNLLPLIP